MKMIGIIFSTAFSLTVLADEPLLTPEEISKAEVAPLELDDIEVMGTLSAQQEAALRIVRQALDEPFSLKRENWDKWRCWFDKPIGTRLTYLHCARNGDLNVLKPRPELGGELSGLRIGDYGTILVSTRPMNEPKVRKMLENLVGTGDNDQVFINMVLKGDKPPRDVPTDDELDRFARAWQRVGALAEEGVSEDRQIAAIQQSGLTLERYNRLATLVEDHAYIKAKIVERLNG